MIRLLKSTSSVVLMVVAGLAIAIASAALTPDPVVAGDRALAARTAAAPDTATPPADTVVTVVMFYAPTCPHCYDIITTVLPPLEEQYGERLDLVLISARTPAGSRLFWDTMDWLGVAEDAAGVPAIFVGSRFLLGGDHATARLAETVAEAMAEGDTTLPDIPGLAEAVAAQRALPDEPTSVADMSVDARLALDPVGSMVALGLLAVMLVSVVLAVDSWRRTGPAEVVGGGWPVWVVPALCSAGLAVAGYLAYVELTDTRAVCGPVGHCNTVQQSPYARLFGVLPIGVLGVAGYALILAVWAWHRVRPGDVNRWTRWALPLITLFGVLFSIYLTFLEPFVIGAVCMWCIGSAVIMTAMLWTTVPPDEIAARLPERYRRGGAEAEAGVDPDPVGQTAADDADVAKLTPAAPSMLRRIATALGYAVGALMGVVIAAIVAVYAKTYLFPPPAVTSVAQANQRAAMENATLVAGLILGVLAWHALRAARSR